MHTCIHAYMHTCIHAYMHTCIHAYMHTCIHAYMHTCIQRGASGASHSRAQRVTHVFTWSTCLHRSHVDHFFWCTHRGFCGPSSLVAPSLLVLSWDSSQRSTWTGIRHIVGLSPRVSPRVCFRHAVGENIRKRQEKVHLDWVDHRK